MTDNYSGYVPPKEIKEPTEYLEWGGDSVGFFIINKSGIKIYKEHPEFDQLNKLRMIPIHNRTVEYCKMLREANMRAGTSKIKYGNSI